MQQIIDFSFKTEVFSFKRFAKKYLMLLLNVYQKRQSRKGLRDLPDYLLRDVGLTKEQAHTELNKSYWLR